MCKGAGQRHISKRLNPSFADPRERFKPLLRGGGGAGCAELGWS